MTEEPRQPEGEAPDEETPAGADAPGPEIEGLEELGQAASEEAPAEEGEAPTDEPAAEEAPAAAEEPAAEGDAPAEEPATEEPAAAEEPAAEGDAPAEEPAAAEDAPAAEEAPRERARGRGGKGGGDQEEVIPGAHLEPDLVLEEQRPEGEYGEYDQYADPEAAYEEAEAGEDAGEPAPVAHTPLELAADARYHATGKRKSAIARVILRPGEGSYTVNGRHLDEYFPRVRLQRMASQPLEAAGYHTRMDVVARIHGGGVSAQANALRHGIARALVEADPALRAEMKRRGYLTRDPREKERKKAGLKKARKRPQFSKR
jgi:small subunit ribosomal protein S9